MVVKTYDPVTLSEKETVTKITSMIWNRRFYKNGSFTMQTTSQVFAVNDIIAYKFGGEIRSGIIMKIVENMDGFTVSGYDLKGVFNFRYITGEKEYTGTPEQIAKNVASEYLLTENRALPLFEIEPDASPEDAEKIIFTPEKGLLESTFETFCIANEIGIFIDFDLQKITMKTVFGRDRSDLIRFGRKYRNVENIEYTNDIFNTYNVIYSVDESENETVTGEASGFLRREGYSSKNPEEYLKEKSPIETVRAEATERYEYNVDYTLGDYVRVFKDNISTVKQITEIKEVHERGRSLIVPIFGTEKENPLTKLLKEG